MPRKRKTSGPAHREAGRSRSPRERHRRRRFRCSGSSVFPGKGVHHDLRAIFDKLNARYFRNALRGVHDHLGPQTTAAAEGVLHFRNDPGRGSDDPHSSPAGCELGAPLVPGVRHLPRDAALGGAGYLRPESADGGSSTPRSFSSASSGSRITRAPVGGKRITSRGFCAEDVTRPHPPASLSAPVPPLIPPDPSTKGTVGFYPPPGRSRALGLTSPQAEVRRPFPPPSVSTPRPCISAGTPPT